MEKLTFQEEEIMLIIWQVKEGVIKDFLNCMEEPRPPYTTVASIVKNLEKKGYLIRYTDSDDKRIVHLKLTEQTDDIVRAIEEKQEALVSCIFAGFSEDEKKNFAAYNARLYQNVMSHLK